MSTLVSADPLLLYRAAVGRRDFAAGSYHRNYRVALPEGPVLLRVPIDGADEMDLRVWPEPELLDRLGPHGIAPRLLHASARPAFQIHEFLPGDPLNAIAPRGTAVPRHVLSDVVGLFAALAGMSAAEVPPRPADWPADGDTAAFAHRLTRGTAAIHLAGSAEFGSLFGALGVPLDPLGPVRVDLDRLTRRAFGLLHADLHRKNMIIHDGRTRFLDWELALWGDPVYDLAVHLHKMAYQPSEQRAVCQYWVAALPATHTTGWVEDLPGYLRHERIKSAVVDTIRYTRLIAAGTGQRTYLVDRMTAKVNAAREAWDLPAPLTGNDVDAAVAEWLGRAA